MKENDGGQAAKTTTPANSISDSNSVLVLDFGSQYSRLIVRRMRELGLYSELRRCDVPLSEISDFNPGAVILSGGPSSVYEEHSPHVGAKFFEWTEQQKIPVLGICYGLQEICHALGGEVRNGVKREFGSTWISIRKRNDELACAKKNSLLAQTLLSDDAVTSASAELANGDGRKSTQEGFSSQQKGETGTACSNMTEENEEKEGQERHTSIQCSRENKGEIYSEADDDLFYGCIQHEENESSENISTHTPTKKQKIKHGDMLVWMSHGDEVAKLPPGFTALASSTCCPYAAVGNFSRRIYGLQFHPEVTHTPRGAALLRNFVIRIAKLQPSWTMKNFLRAAVENIRQKVGEDGMVLGALSGGVDSTVAAALVCRAIGKRFRGVLIDTGLLRQDEASTTLNALQSLFANASVDCVDAHEAFLTALSGVKDPEEKRKIIGKLFIDQFEAYVNQKKIPAASTFLLQGTLYPDVIESSSHKEPSHTIKTHHNVGGLPEKMRMKVLEPLRDLFKDEVRTLGLELGIPRDRLYRHPFPGPGLAVRIVGEVTAERVAVLQRADTIFIEEIRKAGLYDQIAQAFVVLLPDAPSVGVMGDCRTYEWTCVLRAVESADYMTADWFRLPYDIVARVSSRITNEVKGVNRVVMDVSSKPPATIEWE